MRLALLATAACALTLIGSQAARSQEPAARTILSGTCQKLVVAGNDITGGCQPTVARALGSGGMRFDFPVLDAATISLTGRSIPNPASGIGSIAVSQVTMTLTKEGVPPQSKPASGRCTFADPYQGVMTIRCVGSFEREPFDIVFRTDGRIPRT